MVLLAFVLGGHANAASSSTVVSMEVPSAISLTDGCTGSPAWNFGTVQPGSTALTSTGAGICRLQFSSSNDSAQLRIAQRDGTGTAMSAPDPNSATLSSGTKQSSMTTATAYDDNLAWFGGYGSRLLTRWNGSTWQSWTGVAAGLNYVYGIDYQPGTPSTWWVVGDNGTVIRSTNANTATPTWSTTPTTTLQAAGWSATRPVMDVEVVSPTLTFVVGSSGWVARTTDNGATVGGWTLYQLPGTGAGHTLHSITVDPGNPNKLVVLDPAYCVCMYYTTTGGPNAGSWTSITPSPGRYWTSITASDSTHWYASAYNGAIYTSADGINWTYRDQSANHFGLYGQISSPPSSPNTAYVVGQRGELLRTLDGGATWTRQQTRFGGPLAGVAASSASNVFVGAAGPTILRSTDADTTGTYTVASQDAGTYTLSEMEQSPGDGRTILAVGGEGVIRRTTDGGSSWSMVSSGVSEPLFAVSWSSGTTAWAVGEGGRILRTTDSGATWTAQPSGVTVRLQDVAAVSTTVAYAVGEAGTIIKTTNGGASWNALASGTTKNLTSVTTSGTNLVVAVGNQSAIIRSTDAGDSFSAIATGTLPQSSTELVGVATGRDTTMYAASAWSKLWRSTDSGSTWSSVPSDPLTGGFVYAMSALGDTVVVGANGGRTAVSHDAGTTWTTTNTTAGDSFKPAILENHRILVPNWFSGYWTIVPSTTSTIADVGGAATWSNPATTTNLFGVCLQAVGASTTTGAGWTVDGNGTCTASDTDPWHAIPTVAEPLAVTASAGQTGLVDLVWGLRTSEAQPPGKLRAAIAFEAVAPNA